MVINEIMQNPEVGSITYRYSGFALTNAAHERIRIDELRRYPPDQRSKQSCILFLDTAERIPDSALWRQLVGVQPHPPNAAVLLAGRSNSAWGHHSAEESVI
jgi:hypothetical protein